MKQFKGLHCLVLLLTTSMLLTIGVIEVYFPWRPSTVDANNYVFNIDQQGKFARWGYEINQRNARILYSLPSTRTQVVLSTFDQIDEVGLLAPVHYYMIDFVSQHLVTGIRIESTTGKSYTDYAVDDSKKSATSIVASSMSYDGTYVVGGVSESASILSVELQWHNGTQMVVPISNGAFLSARFDGMDALWVMGLDPSGRPISNTLTFINNQEPSSENYALKQMKVEDGVIIGRSFSQTTSSYQTCIELTYVTIQVLQAYFSSSGAMTAQQACVYSPGNRLGPSVSTYANGSTILGGYTSDPTLVRILIRWSDGSQQSILVEDGFYFAYRKNASLTVLDITGRDTNGRVVLP